MSASDISYDLMFATVFEGGLRDRIKHSDYAELLKRHMPSFEGHKALCRCGSGKPYIECPEVVRVVKILAGIG